MKMHKHMFICMHMYMYMDVQVFTDELRYFAFNLFIHVHNSKQFGI